jgi:hypothetical protein
MVNECDVLISKIYRPVDRYQVPHLPHIRHRSLIMAAQELHDKAAEIISPKSIIIIARII